MMDWLTLIHIDPSPVTSGAYQSSAFELFRNHKKETSKVPFLPVSLVYIQGSTKRKSGSGIANDGNHQKW